MPHSSNTLGFSDAIADAWRKLARNEYKANENFRKLMKAWPYFQHGLRRVCEQWLQPPNSEPIDIDEAVEYLTEAWTKTLIAHRHDHDFSRPGSLQYYFSSRTGGNKAGILHRRSVGDYLKKRWPDRIIQMREFYPKAGTVSEKAVYKDKEIEGQRRGTRRAPNLDELDGLNDEFAESDPENENSNDEERSETDQEYD